MGQHHARIYSKLPEVELVGVVDIDEGKSNAIAAQAEGYSGAERP